MNKEGLSRFFRIFALQAIWLEIEKLKNKRPLLIFS